MDWENDPGIFKALRDAGYELIEADFTDGDGEGNETYTVYIRSLTVSEES